MLGRKFFVMVGAVFLVLLVSLPANAASYGGSVVAPNAYGIDSLEWGFGDDLNEGVNKNVNSFWINFLDGDESLFGFTGDDSTSNSMPNDPVIWLEEGYLPSDVFFYNAKPESPNPEPYQNAVLTIDTYQGFNVQVSGLSGAPLFGNLGGLVPRSVPIPGAAWLLGSGLLGLCGLRRRNRKA